MIIRIGIKIVIALISFWGFNVVAQTQIVPSSSPHNCRIGLTLSGGAARGFAHIGVLRAFEEAGITIDFISGSSMGSLIGLFFAAGKTPDEMMEIAKTIKKNRLKAGLMKVRVRKSGLNYMENIIKQHISQIKFDELQKPLYVCVTNFESGKYEIIHTGEILSAIKASVAIPFVFNQQIINGMAYVDGGVLNNLPVEPLREHCEIVVGISVNQIESKNNKMKLRNKIMRVCELIINGNETARIAMCDYHLDIPGMGNIDFEAYEQVQEIHDLGYRAAKEFIAKYIVNP